MKDKETIELDIDVRRGTSTLTGTLDLNGAAPAYASIEAGVRFPGECKRGGRQGKRTAASGSRTCWRGLRLLKRTSDSMTGSYVEESVALEIEPNRTYTQTIYVTSDPVGFLKGGTQ